MGDGPTCFILALSASFFVATRTPPLPYHRRRFTKVMVCVGGNIAFFGGRSNFDHVISGRWRIGLSSTFDSRSRGSVSEGTMSTRRRCGPPDGAETGGGAVHVVVELMSSYTFLPPTHADGCSRRLKQQGTGVDY